MLVRYYKIGQMAYAKRQRYIDISKFEYYKEEDNRSVKLGNGANTSVKTQIDSLDEPRQVTYVTIDDTRWFVTDYIYLNGKQVEFNLQRDVVGEFGLGTSYGKIERGYTDGILKYRKELSLNEVLTKRVPLKSSSNTYGNLEVSNHDGEMWGILYFTKDGTDKNVSIEIPSFTPSYEIGTPPQIGKQYKTGDVRSYVGLSADLLVYTTRGGSAVRFTYNVSYDYEGTAHSSISYVLSESAQNIPFLSIYGTPAGWSDSFLVSRLEDIKNYLDQNLETNGFSRPSIDGIYGLDDAPENADGKIYKDGIDYYQYSASYSKKENSGIYNPESFINGLNDYIKSQTSNQWTCLANYNGFNLARSKLYVDVVEYTKTKIPSSEAGVINVSMSQQLVDEPYCILVFPLYTVDLVLKTDESNVATYSVSKKEAFNIFNEVIRSLSGANSILVDAQIYPYCPLIDKVQTTLVSSEDKKSYPFMSVLSTSFETNVSVQPRPYLDVKKEYITRSYSIVSPDQSSKFTFNLYDYVREFVEDEADKCKNAVTVNIKIKTALKPFSIISSAVIERVNSLKGINYDSNLEGSQSASGGFECSLVSDAFETYKRQNSNYQQLFDIDRNELIKNQEVEKVNEATQYAMNIITGTTFGAITGAQIGDLAGSKGKAIGAAIGATASAAAIATAGGVQIAKNNELREYEREIQQQRFDLTIGTVKNLPNSVNRISSFNEIIMKDFYYVLETYECTSDEMEVVENFIENYGYGIGVFDFLANYQRNGWFLKASVTKSELPITLHQAFKNDIEGGVYINE